MPVNAQEIEVEDEVMSKAVMNNAVKDVPSGQLILDLCDLLVCIYVDEK